MPPEFDLAQFAPADSWMALSDVAGRPYRDWPSRVYPGIPGTNYDGPRWPWLTGPTPERQR